MPRWRWRLPACRTPAPRRPTHSVPATVAPATEEVDRCARSWRNVNALCVCARATRNERWSLRTSLVDDHFLMPTQQHANWTNNRDRKQWLAVANARARVNNRDEVIIIISCFVVTWKTSPATFCWVHFLHCFNVRPRFTECKIYSNRLTLAACLTSIRRPVHAA